jgi:thioredoxin 1
MSIPNVLFFKGGEVVDQIVGAMPKQQFVDRIEKMIGAAV